MLLGMSISTFTLVHVILSLIGVVSGLVVARAMLHGHLRHALTSVFLATTILTSVTGFPIPPYGFDPARVVGTLSLVLLACAVAGFFVFKLAGQWRSVYVSTALAALYLNCFVAVTQAFQKVPVLHALAPTQSSPAFAIAQLAVLTAFVLMGVIALKRRRPIAAA